MDYNIKQTFIQKWNQYFPNTELPIVFFYTDDLNEEINYSPSSFRCIIDELSRVRSGETVVFDAKTPMCAGGKRYMGFSQTLRPNFNYFLSCGIPGKLEGERYKKTPEIVEEVMKDQPPYTAPGKYIIFKRWDNLNVNDNPSVVIFFAAPDVLSGLFTLANFDEIDRNAVISPFASACSNLVYFPSIEAASNTPKAILGMFDASARPYVTSSELTFAVPLSKFVRMINNMDESFLITNTWKTIRNRITIESKTSKV